MKLNDKIYNFLKWFALIAIPAVVVFLTTCLPLWGVDATISNMIVQTISAVGTLIGALIAVSTANYNKTV